MRGWLSGSLLSMFPTSLGRVIRATLKKSLCSNNKTETTSDKLWISSIDEVGLGSSDAAYPCFSGGNSSRIRKFEGKARSWALRSVSTSGYSSGSTIYSYYNAVGTDGKLTNLAQTISSGVVPCFCI